MTNIQTSDHQVLSNHEHEAILFTNANLILNDEVVKGNLSVKNGFITDIDISNSASLSGGKTN